MERRLSVEQQIPGTLKFGIKQSRKKKSLQKLHQDITSWKSKIHTPSLDRSKVTSRSQIITARVSTIINAAVEVVSGDPTVGRCYVAVFLENEDQVIKGLVCRGYIYDLNPVSGNGAMVAKEGDRLRIESQCSLAGVTLRVRGTQLRNQVIPGGWTGTDKSSTEGPGFQRSIGGTNPGVGGNPVAEIVPDNARWWVKGWRQILVTDATAATRQFRLAFELGSAVTGVIYASETQAASLSFIYSFFLGWSAGNITGNTEVPGFMPDNLIMESGDKISSSFDNPQAGDDRDAPVLQVEEWLVP